MRDPWPNPADTSLERARRIANTLLSLLPAEERQTWADRAHALGETWLSASLVTWGVDDIVPTKTAAELVHMKPSTIRKWHSEGDLRNVTRGRYRVGDVLDCAAVRRARRAA